MGHGSSSRITRDKKGDQDIFYKHFYQLLSCGNKQGFVARRTHKSLERYSKTNCTILELGTGDGLHLHFVKKMFYSYLATDISASQIVKAKANFKDDVRNIRFKVENAENLKQLDNSFDRVIASCILLHLVNPEIALEEWRRVCRNGGSINIYIPSEPELILRICRWLITGRRAKKLGYDGFKILMAREHINHSYGLEKMIEYVFRDDDIKTSRWPFRVSPLFLSIYTIHRITVTKPIQIAR
jgi:ubiquinone/menaquinone biosynthesis C-methylase UbiE